MQKKDKRKEATGPIIKVTLLNYDPGRQDTYSKKFMLPLVEGLLKRIQFAQSE